MNASAKSLLTPLGTVPFSILVALVPASAQNSQTQVRYHAGSQFDEYFGETICAVGDLDRDGADDYVIGASRYATAAGEVGRIVAVSGASGATLYQLDGSQAGARAGARFGFWLARIGDVDRDGVDDFVVGAPLDRSAGSESGRVWGISGATGRGLWTHIGPRSNARLGWSVSRMGAIGTLPRGGYVAVGAPANGSIESRVQVLSAETGGLVAELRAPAHHRLGTAVAAHGSLVAAGAPGSGPRQEGSVRFFRLEGSRIAEYPTYLSFASNAQIGTSIAAYGTSSWNFALGGGLNGQAAGRVELVHASIVRVSTVRTLFGTRAGDGFGWSVAVGRDADGDGVADLLVGAPYHSLRGPQSGAFHFHSGRTLNRSYSLLGATGAAYGWDVEFLPDVTGDGVADLGIGESLADFGRVTNAGAVQIASIDIPGQSRNYGTGCSFAALGSNTPRLAVGQPIQLATTGLPSVASGLWLLGLAPQDLSLTPFGMTSCALLVDPAVTTAFSTTSGRADLTVPMPNDPSLFRQRLFVQTFVMQAGINPAGMVSTRGLELTLGNR